jgi:ketosteroid isomerase-like protein
MSQENVEVVRAMWAAYARGDFEASLGAYTEDTIWDDTHYRPDGAVHLGRDALVDVVRTWRAAWDDYDIEAEEVLDAGDDRVAVVLRETGRGKGGGVEMANRWGQVTTLRSRQIVHTMVYRRPEEALEAVGLPERAMSQENVETARKAYEAFNRGEVEAVVEILDPAVVWWPAEDEPVTDPHLGHDGYRALISEARELVPDLQVHVEEVFAVGHRVVSHLHFWGRGRDSGVPIEIRETHVARFHDGKVVEVREYRDKTEALEAVGLSFNRRVERRDARRSPAK